jgi:hypothetical protein
MKKQTMLLVGLAMCLCHTSLFSQADAAPKREFGIQINGINFNGFTPFSGIYKKQLAENKYRRISGSFGNLQLDGVRSNVNFQFSAGLSVGVEKRKVVGKKSLVYTAPEFNIGMSFGKSSNFDPYWSISPGVSWVFGLQYDINEYWALNFEGGPGAFFSFRQFPGNSLNFSIGGSFSSNIGVAIMHKF